MKSSNQNLALSYLSSNFHDMGNEHFLAATLFQLALSICFAAGSLHSDSALGSSGQLRDGSFCHVWVPDTLGHLLPLTNFGWSACKSVCLPCCHQLQSTIPLTTVKTYQQSESSTWRNSSLDLGLDSSRHCFPPRGQEVGKTTQIIFIF